MATEHLPDEQRLLIVTLITKEWVRIRNDPDMMAEAQECEDIISRFSGTDTRVMFDRAYPSKAQQRESSQPK